MLEAVNSVLSNNSSTRASAEQVSTVRSFAANPERIQEAARPSITRTITIDNNINRAILEIRDNNSGDVVRQFPTEGQLKAYQTAQQFAASRESRQNQVETQQVSSPAPASATTQAPVQASAPAPEAPVAPSIQTASVQTEA